MAFRTNKTPVLQTKSASGSVATFNTALAMPLVNGEFTIQAYQEGSGDPSPVNVRNIIPINAINITKTGVNMFDYSNTDIRKAKIVDYSTGNISNWGSSWNATNSYIPVVPNVEYELYNPVIFSTGGTAGVAFYDKEYQYISGRKYNSGFVGNSLIFTTPQNAYYMRFCGTDITQVSLSPNKPSAYIPYNGEIKTVALGEDVYGGTYNSVSGKKIKSYKTDVFNLTNAISKTDLGTYSRYLFALSSTCIISDKEQCNYAPRSFDYSSQTTHFYCGGNNSNRAYLFLNNSITELSNIQIKYLLAEPIETDIGATEIQTFNGVNNIFCDTGDTSLVYKDLDIAKRGNFREVFKLPS